MRFDRYMAVPFVRKGRTLSGADCFGLYALILAHEAGVVVPDPEVDFTGRNVKEATAAVTTQLALGNWRKVDAPQMFDAVVMTGFTQGRMAVRDDFHIGCVIGDGRMLHTEAHSGPRIHAISDPEIAHRIRFFCRPALLMQRNAA